MIRLNHHNSKINTMKKGTNQLIREIKAADASVEKVRKLLESGVDVNAGHALAKAAWYGHADIVRLLLQSGADINAGYPLEAAASNGQTDIVRILLEAGADVNAGYPLKGAAWNGYADIVRLLLEAGANLNPCPSTWSFHTALSAAAGNGQMSTRTHEFGEVARL